jgi:hypothetical protein
MRALKSLSTAVILTAALLTGGLAAIPAASAAPAIPAASAAPAAPAGNGCQYVFEPPDNWVLQCTSGGGTPGGPGSGSGGGQHKYACTVTLLSKVQIAFLQLPKPPKGDKWASITCPGNNPFQGVTLVSANGTPAVTPQELLQIAIGELRVPVLQPGTAPPPGKDGLVGLPEWFWIPAAQWQPASVTVSAGPVFATATATPVQLTFDPGGGLPGASCAGPGTAYSAAAAGNQAANCTYTYQQSSALQPGGAYPAAVTVTWRVTWIGSGGTGGTLNNGLQVAFPLSVPVAEGQALVTS